MRPGVRGLVFVFVLFLSKTSLCSPGGPRAHFVEQAGIELIELFASASIVLALKAHAAHAHFCLSEAWVLST